MATVMPPFEEHAVMVFPMSDVAAIKQMKGRLDGVLFRARMHTCSVPGADDLAG